MREHPQGIRSVTLDSVEPPEVVTAGSFAPNAREGFERLFRACTAQPQCWPRRPWNRADIHAAGSSARGRSGRHAGGAANGQFPGEGRARRWAAW